MKTKYINWVIVCIFGLFFGVNPVSANNNWTSEYDPALKNVKDYNSCTNVCETYVSDEIMFASCYKDCSSMFPDDKSDVGITDLLEDILNNLDTNVTTGNTSENTSEYDPAIRNIDTYGNCIRTCKNFENDEYRWIECNKDCGKIFPDGNIYDYINEPAIPLQSDNLVSDTESFEECQNICEVNFNSDSSFEDVGYINCIKSCQTKHDKVFNEGEVTEWDKLFATATNPAECGGIMTSRFLELLVQIYNTIILVAGVGAIILAASEFLKATSSDEKDSVNKAFKRLMTRIVILIILFILPQIIIFILNTFGDEAMKTCLERF